MKLEINPSNKKYYSEDFIKGFECGVERQFNADMEEKTAELRVVGNTTMHYECSLCGGAVDKWDNYCKHCGAKMKGEVEREKAGQTTEEPIKHFGSIECPNCGRLLMLEEPLRIKVENPEIKVDLISREDVLNIIDAEEWEYMDYVTKIKCGNTESHLRCYTANIRGRLSGLPAIPQTDYENYEAFGWCKGCKEYDTEKHCCHRYSSFIRESLQENINAVLEDIKAEIKEEMSNAKSTGYLNGLNMVLMIIDEKHISGKEE